MEMKTLLESIWFTDSMTFNEWCAELGADCPEESNGWKILFRTLNVAEDHDYVSVTRRGNKILTLQLSEEGKERLLKLREDSNEQRRNDSSGMR